MPGLRRLESRLPDDRDLTPSLPVVVIGSDHAGYSVAGEFCKLCPETPLLLLSRDHTGLYLRPMLSNALARQGTRTVTLYPVC